MFSRGKGESFLNRPSGTTTAIGPPNYQPFKDTAIKKTTSSAAPFLSTDQRWQERIAEQHRKAEPSPAHYYPPVVSTACLQVKGYTSLGFNTAARFAKPKGMATGPPATRYDTRGDISKRILAVKPPLRRRKPPIRDYASIPSKNIVGYTEMPGGRLQQVRHEYEPPPGPDRYFGAAAPPMSHELYHGIHFLQTPRMPSPPSRAPPPNRYNVDVLSFSPWGPNNTGVKFGTDKLRSLDRLVRQERHKWCPGPGAYHFHDPWHPDPRHQIPTSSFTNEGRKKTYFKVSDTPGPETYPRPKSPSLYFYEQRGMQKGSNIAGKAERFREGGGDVVPGPGRYNLPCLADKWRKQKWMTRTVAGAFLVSTERSTMLFSKTILQVPPSTRYTPRQPVKAVPAHGSAFRSKTRRMTQKEISPVVPQIAPNRYNLTIPLITGHPASKATPFFSSMTRFGPFGDPKMDRRLGPSPSPGSYDPKVCKEQKNLMTSKKKRFQSFVTPVPAPNHYRFSRIVGDSTFKPTFNVTIPTKPGHVNVMKPTIPKAKPDISITAKPLLQRRRKNWAAESDVAVMPVIKEVPEGKSIKETDAASVTKGSAVASVTKASAVAAVSKASAVAAVSKDSAVAAATKDSAVAAATKDSAVAAATKDSAAANGEPTNMMGESPDAGSIEEAGITIQGTTAVIKKSSKGSSVKKSTPSVVVKDPDEEIKEKKDAETKEDSSIRVTASSISLSKRPSRASLKTIKSKKSG